MSNEEIVSFIQSGDASKLSELWEGVRGYVAKMARSYMAVYDGRYGVEFDDLMQSGFLAMAAAAESYEPGEAKFLTWFTYHLKTAFAETANGRTKRQRNDPLRSAASLHEPIYDIDDGKLLLQDTIPGPDAFEDVERKIYGEQLRCELEAVLSTIPAENANVLRLHFFEGKELAEIAKSRGECAQTVSARKREGLRNMRQKVYTFQGAGLRAYIEDHTNYYSGMGMKRYLVSLSSPVELKVIGRERLAAVFEKPAYPEAWNRERDSVRCWKREDKYE